MMTLIDTNRLQLLAALGYSFETVSDEVEAFAELNLFFVQARQRRSDRKLKLPKGGDKEEKADKPEKKAERGGAKAGSEGDADGLEASG